MLGFGSGFFGAMETAFGGVRTCGLGFGVGWLGAGNCCWSRRGCCGGCTGVTTAVVGGLCFACFNGSSVCVFCGGVVVAMVIEFRLAPDWATTVFLAEASGVFCAAGFTGDFEDVLMDCFDGFVDGLLNGFAGDFDAGFEIGFEIGGIGFVGDFANGVADDFNAILDDGFADECFAERLRGDVVTLAAPSDEAGSGGLVMEEDRRNANNQPGPC